jgi:hypothetical protein
MPAKIPHPTQIAYASPERVRPHILAQERRFYPSMVVRVTGDGVADRATDPFASITVWDDAAPRPDLTATR